MVVGLNFNQLKTFFENNEQVRFWLWFVSKIPNNTLESGSLLILEKNSTPDMFISTTSFN